MQNQIGRGPVHRSSSLREWSANQTMDTQQPRVMPMSIASRSLNSDDLDPARGRPGLRTLHDPGNPYLEIIFVHGLMGDSQLTWTFDNDGKTFWPTWLAEEDFFSNTRIHTYGYHEPPVNGRAPVSKIRDIGVALCAALESNSYIRGDAYVRVLHVPKSSLHNRF